jgi:hypothetical protein
MEPATDFLDDPSRSMALMHRRCRAGVTQRSPVASGGGLVSTIRVEGVDGDAGWSCFPPAELASREPELLERYLAAAVNNLVMTHGGHRVHLGLSQPLADKVISRVCGDYGQALDVMRIRSAKDGDFFRVGPRLRSEHDEADDVPPRPRLPPRPVATPSLGIDVGNSAMKIVEFSGDRGDAQRTVALDRSLFRAGPAAFFAAVAQQITQVRATTEARGERLRAVGIAWFGDSYKGAPLTQAADLQTWNVGPSAQELAEVPARLATSAGCDTHFWGDSEALGRCLAELGLFARCYLLILGTSTGGLYLDSRGRYGEGANLVSRIVIDLGPDAPRHTATGARGVLQQYSGSYGLKRVLAGGPAGVRVEDGGRELARLLRSSQQEERAWAEDGVSRLAAWINAGVADLGTHYDIGRIVLAGGNARDVLGRALSRRLREAQLVRDAPAPVQVELLSELTGWPESYEVATAAAMLGALSASPSTQGSVA